MVLSLSLRRKIAVVAVYAVAMGYAEAAVVVYLRSIYYPQGFSFPVAGFAREMVSIEVAREAATIVMLGSLAHLIGSPGRLERLSFFSLAFGVWDIFYYVFLRVIIGWPASVLDWDVLFLIPLPWTAPVLAPLIVSAFLVVGAIVTLSRAETGRPVQVGRVRWVLLIGSALAIVIVFLWNVGSVMERNVPPGFPWLLFAAALAAGTAAFWSALRER